jgi:hypothetical protein
MNIEHSNPDGVGGGRTAQCPYCLTSLDENCLPVR